MRSLKTLIKAQKYCCAIPGRYRGRIDRTEKKEDVRGDTREEICNLGNPGLGPKESQQLGLYLFDIAPPSPPASGSFAHFVHPPVTRPTNAVEPGGVGFDVEKRSPIQYVYSSEV